MQLQHQTHGFGAFYDNNSKYLILGSFPSVKSRESSFFYGHPQNRFWKVAAAVFSSQAPVSLAEKKQFLKRNRIALYDVIESCDISGSSDASIQNVQPADLMPILEAADIEDRIFINGAKAYQLYMRYQFHETGIRPVRLPSTSPANAAWSLERLIESWELAIKREHDHA